MANSQIADRIDNPFANRNEVAAVSTALVHVEQQRAIAEVQARMIVARANPRDPIRAVDQILQDCTRPTLANQALYQYSRGGTDITGPSIRLAEAMAQRWGNIASGIKEISRRDGYSECVAYAWDLETGYYDERQFQVRHWRDTRSGGHALKDERDIYELVANMGQRRKRAVLLTVIPGDVIEAAVSQCERTLEANADTSPEAMKRLLEAFAGFGISREQIEKRCQRRLDAIRPAQVVLLRKIYASLKDGMSEPRDWFEMPPVEPRPRREDFIKQEPEPSLSAAPTFVVINEQGEEEEYLTAPDAVERCFAMLSEYARTGSRSGLEVCFDNNDRLIADLNDAGKSQLGRVIEEHYRMLIDELRDAPDRRAQDAGESTAAASPASPTATADFPPQGAGETPPMSSPPVSPASHPGPTGEHAIPEPTGSTTPFHPKPQALTGEPSKAGEEGAVLAARTSPPAANLPPQANGGTDAAAAGARGSRREPVAAAAERNPTKSERSDRGEDMPEAWSNGMAGGESPPTGDVGQAPEPIYAKTGPTLPWSSGPEGKTAAFGSGAPGPSGQIDIVTELGRKLTEAARQGQKALDHAWLRLSEQERDIARPMRAQYREIAAQAGR